MELIINNIGRSTFALKDNEGENKVTDLKEAINLSVKPGAVIHLGEGSNAAAREIIRQFKGTNPAFSLVMCGFTTYAMDLVHYDLVKKIISPFAGELYLTPGPSRVFSRAYKEKKVTIELWSLYSITQRLIAGALDVGFVPTKSLEGTSIAEENKDSYRLINDPFDSSKKIGVVKALNPDLSIVHGWAADLNGNTILSPQVFSGEEAWGARASKNGVVVTVEKIVPTSFIRRYSYMVKIPGYLVRSVSVAPLGAHPQGMTNYGIEEFEPYGEDYDFYLEHRKATRSFESLEKWLKEWVIDCPTQEDYLRRLGQDKISFLKEKGRGDSWEEKMNQASQLISKSNDYNPVEMMIVAAARKIEERVKKQDYKIILSGVGAAGLAGWLAYYQMKKKGVEVEILLGSGFYGLVPQPGDPVLLSLSNIHTCKLTGGVVDAYGFLVCGYNKKSLSLLAGGQVDKYGNINSAKIGNNAFLTGPGGAGDAYQAQEVMLVMAQSKDRFLDKVPYITSSGKNVKTLVSTMGIFEKADEDKELCLTGYFSANDITGEKRIREVIENCGWELKVSPEIKEISPPTFEELITLRLLDPKGYFLREN